MRRALLVLVSPFLLLLMLVLAIVVATVAWVQIVFTEDLDGGLW